MTHVRPLDELLERYKMPVRPRWDADRPLYYVSQTPPRDGGPWKMYRWFPTLNSICEPLLGHSERDRQTGRTIGVRYPRMQRRYALYREALELIAVTKHRGDLLTLAMYRRQVSLGSLAIDELFVALADSFDPALSLTEWRNIAERMPSGSWVHAACYARVNTRLILEAPIAAQ